MENKDELCSTASMDALVDVLGHIAGGDFSARCIRTQKNDQLEALCLGINMLAEEIEARISNLEKMNKFFINRELAMTELKRKNKELEAALQKATGAAAV